MASTKADMEKMLRQESTEIEFFNNPHMPGSKIYMEFAAASGTRTIGDAKATGATLGNLRKWVAQGVVVFTRKEVKFENEEKSKDDKVEAPQKLERKMSHE